MKKLIVSTIAIIALFIFAGCSTTSLTTNILDKDVALQKGYVNHFEKPYLEVNAKEDVEDIVVYMPKNTTTLRVRLHIANLEDLIYMKLVTEDAYEIDKILRRVEDIKTLGYKQDGYMYEPSLEKNVVTLQVYVPSVYIYKASYQPKLIFSFKRDSRSIQESINLKFLREIYSVSKKNDAKEERPVYSSLEVYCKSSKKADKEFFTQTATINDNRLDLETIKELEASCR